MHLPNRDRAIIVPEKVQYLLDPAHPRNHGKAAFFLAFGFAQGAPDMFVAALR